MTAPLRLECDVPCSPDRALGLWASRTDQRWPPGRCAPPARPINRRHPCPDPAGATQVEVQFLASAPGGTRARLEHRAWDALDDGAVRRDRNQAGWQQVLQLHTAAPALKAPATTSRTLRPPSPPAAACPASPPSVRDAAGHSPIICPDASTP